MNAKGLQFKFLYFAEHGTFKMTRIAATSALITVAKISITGSVLITGDATSHIIFSLIIRFPSDAIPNLTWPSDFFILYIIFLILDSFKLR